MNYDLLDGRWTMVNLEDLDCPNDGLASRTWKAMESNRFPHVFR
jgi:hypothetical protein